MPRLGTLLKPTKLSAKRHACRAVAATATAALAVTALGGTVSAAPEAAPGPRADLAPIESPVSKIPAETRARITAELRKTHGVPADAGVESTAAAEEVFRVSGRDRYATSVETSWYTPWGDIDGDGELGEVEFEDGSFWVEEPAPVVYVATGGNYPDALSAAAPAGLQGGPLLLTRTDSLPGIVADEIERLQPEQIVVAGGEGAVSADVYDELAEIEPNIRRDAGSTRYETSRVLSERGFAHLGDQFPGGAFITTGKNFPDALASSAAGGTYALPVVLVPGAASGLDAETEALFSRMGIDWASIVGGTGAVSEGIEADLIDRMGGDYVERLGGATRYETAVAINDGYFGWDHDVNGYLPVGANIATGKNFPDALGAGALAGMYQEPLYTSRQDCLPNDTLDHMRYLEVQEVWLYGGESALSPAVEALTTC
ncbi:cell wall-binding repeat-containing protein [Myceligenerans salitolerans]|uniref:Cell wall-binding repeat-containing protein n=1 Tax=Myceligenerans salitolerans TaxID=1230528 RepID=A0ABS3I841_9MICO|nr:cell wall-binding repeat-containing protein [Myceligenerans salitolerans]MBO0609169.1 cell wall-binding repeat-containing protein [Myceligenerans salitolerans]